MPLQWERARGLKRFYFAAIESLPGFFHGIFGRWALDGRQDEVPFNLGLDCGSPDAEVWRNRQRMLASFGEAVDGIYARQVHGTAVGIVNCADQDRSGPHLLDGDALITSQGNQGLVIQAADCQPVIIVDPVKSVAANVHSGWRGSVKNIIGATVARMVEKFQCRPRDLIGGVGPSLGPCCAEFVNYTRELPETIWGLRRPGDLFDFWELSRSQLITAGLSAHNIHISQTCTRCNEHLFYSYRGEGQAGRFAAIVGIRK